MIGERKKAKGETGIKNGIKRFKNASIWVTNVKIFSGALALTPEPLPMFTGKKTKVKLKSVYDEHVQVGYRRSGSFNCPTNILYSLTVLYLF